MVDLSLYQGSGLVGSGRVTMADGSVKALREITPGEQVLGVGGQANTVLDVKKVFLGNRHLIATADFKLLRAPEIPIWTRNPDTGRAWWGSWDAPLSQCDTQRRIGNLFSQQPAQDCTAMAPAAELGLATGWQAIEMVRVDAADHVELLELLLDQDEAYFVDGYLVTTNANSGSFDWAHFSLTSS